MARLKGTGAPSRDLVAAVGDIYTDETTGKSYKCVFAFRDGIKETLVTQWYEMKNAAEPEEIKPELKQSGPIVADKIVAGEKPEPVKQPDTTKRKNYTNYNKAKSKQGDL